MDKLLKNSCEEIGVYLSDGDINKFMLYMDMLVDWNNKYNLTAIIDKREIVLKHFVDSLTIYSLIDKGNKTAIDVGSGAGFPGLPLAIATPNTSFTLMDSLNKRIVFLEAVANELCLENVQAIHMRAEDGGKTQEHREKYDYCFSRAVANLAILGEYCLPLVDIGGKFISMKGADIKDEIADAKQMISLLGGEIEEIKTIKIPFADITHSLIIISKLRQTPTNYPRKHKQMSRDMKK